MGDDRTALQAVVAADAELMALRAEEAELTQRLDATHLDEQPDEGALPSTSGADADSDRLAAIYERMQVCLHAGQLSAIMSLVALWRLCASARDPPG